MIVVRQVPRRIWLRRALIAILAIIVAAGSIKGVERLTSAPATQREAEAHLDRSVLFYDVWGGTGFVVFEYGGSVHFDRLRIDLISIDWPPTLRWQWTGWWWTIDTTANPASAGVGSTARLTGPSTTDPPRHYVIFGQVNAPEIVWLEALVDGKWTRYAVSYPGFAVRLPGEATAPTEFRWLDANESVVWMVSIG